jgi:hypothetical protein
MLRRVATQSQLTPEMCLMRALHLFDEFSTRSKSDLKELLDARTARSECAREWWKKQSTEEKQKRAMKANRARWKKADLLEGAK